MGNGASDAEERLYGLIEIAEQHQAAVQAALEGLTAERMALQAERKQLGLEVRGLDRQVRSAVQGAVADSMFVAAETGAAALKAATGSLLGRLDQVGTTAGQAEATLRRMVEWASWRRSGQQTCVISPSLLKRKNHLTNMLFWQTANSEGQILA